MSIKCIVVEDQPPAQRILRKFIEDAGSLELKGVFSDGLSAMEFLKTEQVDLMFLDIHLPKISGIEFLKSLKNRPYVILTTAFSEYALEGYDLDVIDYLLKPFSFQRFLQAINKVPALGGNEAQADTKELYVKSGHEFIKVNIEDIISINSDSDYTEIQLGDKKVLSNESLKHWLAVLDSKKFIQLHKSYIINTSKIARVSGNQVFMELEVVVPIGRAYKEQFMNRLTS
ncbi:LytR/AlgR family response regulator transcription factor [Croceivirga thetidis]|uniref:Response regulator transcription factor n=1 Tax=Croceivirga thetidis TaxID=2721623 RepID=A0ABX1GWG6_9FLAO|nr:response regulator transcription factor [Croceivirga thetidis]NKI33351.1 response regulator transcription factor [Croceivirga thetidis]